MLQIKTTEGHIIKILVELLKNNIKQGCFQIDEKTITFRMCDNSKRTLIDIVLFADNFSVFKFEGQQTLNIGLNHVHLYNMLKSIKKKDSIILSIGDNNEEINDLLLQIIPKENTRTTVSHLKITNTQNIEIPLPEGYDKPINVSSSEYQKMCKNMHNIGSTITVSSKKFYIKFSCDAGSIYGTESSFGEIDDEEGELVTQVFDIEQLTRVSKISGLGTTLQIYQKEGLPLQIRSNIGNLGKMCIFIKSKQQLEDESTLEE